MVLSAICEKKKHERLAIAFFKKHFELFEKLTSVCFSKLYEKTCYYTYSLKNVCQPRCYCLRLTLGSGLIPTNDDENYFFGAFSV